MERRVKFAWHGGPIAPYVGSRRGRCPHVGGAHIPPRFVLQDEGWIARFRGLGQDQRRFRDECFAAGLGDAVWDRPV